VIGSDGGAGGGALLIDSDGFFFIDVGVADGHYDGVDGDIHPDVKDHFVRMLQYYIERRDKNIYVHYHIKNLQSNTSLNNRYYLKSTTSHSKCLEQPIHYPRPEGYLFDS